MKNIIYLVLFFSFTSSFAQVMPDVGYYNIRINDIDKSIKAQVLPVTSAPTAKANLDYYWYDAGNIHDSQGGYIGKLLNGSYNEFYNNKNLKKQGSFEKGLKNGVWKDWNENGKLIQLVTWNDGIMSGKFSDYDEGGKLLRTGYYHNNLLQGKVIYNEGADSIKTVIYDKGKIIIPVKKRPFLKRINIFRKKDKVQTSQAPK